MLLSNMANSLKRNSFVKYNKGLEWHVSQLQMHPEVLLV